MTIARNSAPRSTNNPAELKKAKIRKRTVVPQHKIDPAEFVEQADGSIDLSKTIYKLFYESFLREDETIAKKIDEQKSVLDEQKSVLRELTGYKTILTDQVSKIEQLITEKEDHSKGIERELIAITEKKNEILKQSEKDKGEIMKQIDRLK